MPSYKITLTLKGSTPSTTALDAIKLLGQRTANEMLAASRLLPIWEGVGPPKLELTISVNNGAPKPLPFVGLVTDRQDPDEDPFAAM